MKMFSLCPTYICKVNILITENTVSKLFKLYSFFQKSYDYSHEFKKDDLNIENRAAANRVKKSGEDLLNVSMMINPKFSENEQLNENGAPFKLIEIVSVN
jgi:hypothetical protein